jgi:hypothetical protein
MPVRFTAESAASLRCVRDIPANAARLGVAAQTPRRARTADLAPYRSKVEIRYAELLETRRRCGEIAAWEYEPERLRLAHRCTFAPDFRVTFPDGHAEWHETKGAFVREDAWLKLKVAAAAYPEQSFVMMQWKGGEWIRKEIPNA